MLFESEQVQTHRSLSLILPNRKFVPPVQQQLQENLEIKKFIKKFQSVLQIFSSSHFFIFITWIRLQKK